MRILVNATNLRVGGGVQKAVEFVRASVASRRGHDYTFALSDVVAGNLRDVTSLGGRDVWVAPASPARPLAGRATARALHEMERRIRPDVVFTVFGPTYLAFERPHLMGFAVPWITHPNRYAEGTLRDPWQKTWSWMWNRRATHWARFADRWVLETEVAAAGLARALGVARSRCLVIPNVCAEQYYAAAANGVADGSRDARMAKRSPEDFHLLVFSAWYPHKNLEMTPRLAAELKRRDPGRVYRFFLTFDPASAAWGRIRAEAARLGVEDRVINLGTIPIGDGPAAYASADALFLPTLLESSTATYPEAMCMRRPIVTTDLDFAKEICGDAAAYFAPNDAAGAAERIAALAGSAAMREDLTRKGAERLARGKRPMEIHDLFVDALEATAMGRAS